MGSGGVGNYVPHSEINNPTYGKKNIFADFSAKSGGGLGGPIGYSYNSGSEWTSTMSPFKPGEFAGKFGPGKYDYYVATDEFKEEPQPGLDAFGQPNKPNRLQKLVQYSLSEKGKPVVDELNAKAYKEADLISGAAVRIEKKRNVQSEIKQNAAAKNAGAGTSAKGPAGQETILTSAAAAAQGSLLGGGGLKTLLGS